MSDFNKTVVEEVAHRPWPMPAGPWVMTQSWHDLLFAHWPVERAQLETFIPASLTIDLFDGHPWVGVVPFRMSNVSARGVPALPWLSAFPELNVRTYVRVADRPGVYFFSLDATNPVAVAVARTLFHLPYHSADMKLEDTDGVVRYRSRRRAARAAPAEFVARYRPVGSTFEATPGSIEYFLTERYCLYAVKGTSVWRVEIHHPPWALQRAEADIVVNTMAEAAGLRLPQVDPLLHFARRQDTVAWRPVRVR